jgi:hypothetical protein
MNDVNAAPAEQKVDNKEYNFRALEAKYKRDLEQERAIRLETERRLQELSQPKHVDDDDDDEPYVDKKRLKKEQEKFGQQIKQDTQSEIQRAVKMALYEKEREDWLNQNPDFYETMNYAEKLAIEHPDLANTILKLPDNFERQQLVYQNIKKLGLNKERPREPSIQEKIDMNRKSPYYQSGGIGSPAYASSSDFSQSGQKNAYDKMQELKNRLRL